MVDLSTTYMGITLKNPIIAGASKLTANMDEIKKLVKHGASAIVCASLFEEQIELERHKLEQETEAFDELHPEMIDVFPKVNHGGPSEHLMWLKKTKESVDVPVIASLNCIRKETWVEYAKKIQETGVDGIELNFYYTPKSFDISAQEIEEEQIAVLMAVKEAVSIPVGVKLSVFYSNPLAVIKSFDEIGVDGFVLFNRFFQPDIDVEKEIHDVNFHLSNPHDVRLAIRFAGLLFGQVQAPVAANNGVFDAQDVIKVILAGASAVQVVSTVYNNGPEHIEKMIDELRLWMKDKSYMALTDFKGKLSKQATKDPFVYDRAQYVDLILKSDKLMK
ncbi:dihydroorotate dehydrogenase-like protein [Candidatus Woesearchaeota archaeon]|nr:dihydroorotate dehydrogenase-like protein [Candidatus Woesearchaeota archaeon]